MLDDKTKKLICKHILYTMIKNNTFIKNNAIMGVWILEIDRKRRKELGSFLKSRRSRLSPDGFGISSTPHRRAQGLRREEVAEMAGVSNIWYTWIEQGRDVQPSAQVLESLGKVLCLNRYEFLYLYMLAGQKSPIHHSTLEYESNPSLQQILEKMEPFPAYIRGVYWDTVAWNKSASELFGDFNQMNDLERNSLWRMFARTDYPDLLPDWKEEAQNLLAQFRFSYAQHVGDPLFEGLVELLQNTSDTFHKWWGNHDVLGVTDGTKRFNHPTLGRLTYKHQLLTVGDNPDLKVTIYIPI